MDTAARAGRPITTTRFFIDRIVLECDGASIAIVSARNEWSDREQLCIEIVTTDPAGDDELDRDDTGLALYCPEPPRAPRPKRVGQGTEPSRRHRAARATAIVAAAALLATVAGTQIRRASASRGPAAPTNAPVNAPPANRSDPDPTDTTTRAIVSGSAELASRCRHMISAASAALGIDDAGLLSSLVADHAGQTLNDAVHQELADARAVLASGLDRAGATSQRTGAGLDALDASIADVDATPCSPRDDGPVTPPGSLSVRAK